ncbi:FabD/lysophospholipase-like protein [Curvularia clavata]|uniref:FabD/lysophospholipase-like protein n=1 Tax=Curvularia clavata TaxID=95742 RepID=A0A9Q8Z351_CURCL|nr:FabD/lysophospholipase-like protein [Curvularia clavata]
MPGHDLRLLALDGGGVRGLSALMILEKLMEAVNPDAPPKPCDYFDMIGGTSTGGLIAVMLGRLKMSVGDCIDAYVLLSKRVFRKTRHRVTIKGQVQGRFNAEELARAIKEVVKQQGLKEDALLRDEPNAPCKVFVCATSKETNETVCLTSYRTPQGNNDLLGSVTIWEACRATSAATSFFDSITIGRFSEEFVDGAIGANNPVRQLWDQARLVWGSELLEGRVKCLVSIGTGVPSLKPFKDDVLHIGKTLIAIATETERTAEQFQRDRQELDSTGRYYRFNVVRGLEDIGLEEAAKVKEMAAATRRYISSHEVYKQMQACAGNIAAREYSGVYQTIFSVEGVPSVRAFVDRPAELADMERVLLPKHRQGGRQKRYILRGLGGIGKTQLAVEFARRHHHCFSAVFWLDGRSKDSVQQSIAGCANRIPKGQIAETSRAYATGRSVDVDAVVKDVLGWLAQPDNTAWLLIFDNVDREYSSTGGDPESYDVRSYFSGADHGSVLITTRLAKLEQLGESQHLGKVDETQAKIIFENWNKQPYDAKLGKQLLERLDGLPLAIAQAGAYLQESGTNIEEYLRFYEQQWDELMALQDKEGAPLQDYPDRSVWITWIISYQAVLAKYESAAHLLLLWSFLDNKDLWHDLFATACEGSLVVQRMLSEWIGDAATSELAFSRAMLILRNYSLVEVVEGSAGYTTHPVVHRWACCSQDTQLATKLGRLAVIAVGFAAPSESLHNCTALQLRIFPHAQAASQWVFQANIQREKLSSDDEVEGYVMEAEQYEAVLAGTLLLSSLFDAQGKLGEAERLCKQALRGYEEALGPSYRWTIIAVNTLAVVYHRQGKLGKTERMYELALRRGEEGLGASDLLTLDIVQNLGSLYNRQRKWVRAEQMYERALRGSEDKRGPTHPLTLDTVNNLGNLYLEQGRFSEAEQMYQRALQGYKKVLDNDPALHHPRTLGTFHNLAILYTNQGKLDEAEKMYKRAIQGYKKTLGDEIALQYPQALDAFDNLGRLYHRQRKPMEAQAMFSTALYGFQSTLGPSDKRCVELASWIHALEASQQKLTIRQRMKRMFRNQ